MKNDLHEIKWKFKEQYPLKEWEEAVGLPYLLGCEVRFNNYEAPENSSKHRVLLCLKFFLGGEMRK